MNDEFNQPDTITTNGMDRRALLKKAGVGGVLLWTAPMVMGASAADAGVCTPKCFPSPEVDFAANSVLECPQNGRKWVKVGFVIGAATCPCGNTGRELEIVLVAISAGNAEFKSSAFDPASGIGELIFGGRGNGALSQGTYVAAVRFRTTCIDRDGTPITVFCNQLFSFTFDPGNGPCSQDFNVGTVTPGRLSCDDPICGPLPG